MKYGILQNSQAWCSAEVLYPRGETQHPPQVQLSCDGLPLLDTSDKEQAFYQQYSANSSAVTATNIPGTTSYSSANQSGTNPKPELPLSYQIMVFMEVWG